MIHLYLKAIHIIGFITWFAGLFYLVRLFVYRIEAMEQKKSTDLINQLDLMIKRLLTIITTPGMIITLIAGISMLIYTPEYLKNGWMHIKLSLIVLLVIYHFRCIGIADKLRRDLIPFDSFKMRLFNEVPTILMVAIVFFAVLKNNLDALYGILGFVVLTVLLFGGSVWYKRKRQESNDH